MKNKLLNVKNIIFIIISSCISPLVGMQQDQPQLPQTQRDLAASLVFKEILFNARTYAETHEWFCKNMLTRETDKTTERKSKVNHAISPLPLLHLTTQEEDTYLLNILLSYLETHPGLAQNINSQNSAFEETPLHVAVRYGHFEHARLLIQAGARGDLRDINQQTPLDLAIQSGNDAMIKLLATALAQQESKKLSEEELIAALEKLNKALEKATLQQLGCLIQ